MLEKFDFAGNSVVRWSYDFASD